MSEEQIKKIEHSSIKITTDGVYVDGEKVPSKEQAGKIEEIIRSAVGTNIYDEVKKKMEKEEK